MQTTIHILLNSIEDFERNKPKIKVSRYISIEDGNDLNILASIQNVSAVQSNDASTINYIVVCTPIYVRNIKFLNKVIYTIQLFGYRTNYVHLINLTFFQNIYRNILKQRHFTNEIGWTILIEALDREKILKAKKTYLVSAFASNPDIRAIVFSDAFLEKVNEMVVGFVQEYLNKYFKKPRLQKPPIFIFGNKHSELMQLSNI